MDKRTNADTNDDIAVVCRIDAEIAECEQLTESVSASNTVISLTEFYAQRLRGAVERSRVMASVMLLSKQRILDGEG